MIFYLVPVFAKLRSQKVHKMSKYIWIDIRRWFPLLKGDGNSLFQFLQHFMSLGRIPKNEELACTVKQKSHLLLCFINFWVNTHSRISNGSLHFVLYTVINLAIHTLRAVISVILFQSFFWTNALPDAVIPCLIPSTWLQWLFFLKNQVWF